jgi:hypothetical protein
MLPEKYATIGSLPMQSALHITAKVLPGNRLEVQLPDGAEGQEVEVFIVMPITPDRTPDPRTALLAEMSRDPFIRAEIAEIDREFAVTEMDGL